MKFISSRIRFCLHCSYLEELDTNLDIDRDETLGQFIKSHDYSELFQKAYLVTMLFAIVIDFDTCIGFFVHSKMCPCFNDKHICSTDSNMCFNLDLSLSRSTGLFCVSHSFILPWPQSSAGFFPLVYCLNSALCVLIIANCWMCCMQDTEFESLQILILLSLCLRVLLFLSLQLFGLPQLLTVRWRLHINKVIFH